MNYSGATATLGLAFAATGVLFPFLSALLGWLGDTSANALLGTLQVVTAEKLRQNPVLMAAANSAGGDDQSDQHRGSGGSHQHEARRRGAPVPLHPAPQYIPGQRDRPPGHVLRLRCPRLGAILR
jgi:hypothetical protein